MRFLLVLFGLLATPFMVSVAQRGGSAQREIKGGNGHAYGHDAAHCLARTVKHPGKDINKCDVATPTSPPPIEPPPTEPPPTEPPPTEPPPTEPPPTEPPPAGASVIDGRVYENVLDRPGLVGWVVELSGGDTRSVVTQATGTYGSGSYAFTGLPAGDYTVCLVLQGGWLQTTPGSGWTPCPTGFGYFFPLNGTNSALRVNFAAVVAP